MSVHQASEPTTFARSSGVLLLGAVLLLLFGPAILAGEHPIFRDSGHWYAPLWEWARGQWGQGSIPLWDPLQNLGESHIADGTTSVFYPGMPG